MVSGRDGRKGELAHPGVEVGDRPDGNLDLVAKGELLEQTTWMQLLKAGLGVNQVAAKTGTTAYYVWAIRVNSGLRPVTPAHVMMRKELSARGPIERVYGSLRGISATSRVARAGACGIADPRILAHKETHIAWGSFDEPTRRS